MSDEGASIPLKPADETLNAVLTLLGNVEHLCVVVDQLVRQTEQMVKVTKAANVSDDSVRAENERLRTALKHIWYAPCAAHGGVVCSHCKGHQAIAERALRGEGGEE